MVTTEPGLFIFTLVAKFCDEVKVHVKGSPFCADLVNSNKRVFEDFMSALSIVYSLQEDREHVTTRHKNQAARTLSG